MSYRRSFSSSTNNEQEIQHQQQQQNNNLQTIDSESARPLSLYDNLSALVASLKPPNLHNNNNSTVNNSNFKNNNNNNFIEYGDSDDDQFFNHNKNIGVSECDEKLMKNHENSINKNQNDNLIQNLREEDFIFSDISFNFPQLNQTSEINLINYNNNNNDLSENINMLHQNINLPSTSNASSNNRINHHHHQYVNIDDDSSSFLNNNSNNINNNINNNNKPVISDAKSTFFGLSNSQFIDRDIYQQQINDSPSKPLLDTSSSSILNNGNSHLSTPMNSNHGNLTSSQNSSYRRFSNEIGECSKFVKNSGSVNDTEKQFSSNSESHNNNNNNNSNQKTVTYVTPEYYGHADKPSQTSTWSLNSPGIDQAVYMTTTVPQNIKGNNIMGRHTPTRNSLRHSRMLVINKNFQGHLKSNPMELQCPGLVKFFLTIQILSGILLTCVGLWILLWAPNTRTQDNPYWSGILLVFTGTLGLILLEFKRSTRKRFREHLFQILKVNSIILFLLTGCCAFAACIFATIHLQNLVTAERDCMPAILFTIASECVCIFGLTADITDHKRIQNPEKLEIPVGGYEFRYPDLSCSEVKDVWRYILLASAIFNIIGAITVLAYFFLFCFKRTKRKYTTTATTSNVVARRSSDSNSP